MCALLLILRATIYIYIYCFNELCQICALSILLDVTVLTYEVKYLLPIYNLLVNQA